MAIWESAKFGQEQINAKKEIHICKVNNQSKKISNDRLPNW
jgi:hypothetical protein